MNSMSTPFDPTAHEQAALWATRLDGSTLSPADEAALQTWLKASPSHVAALSQYRDFSAELDDALPDLVQAGLVSMPAPAAKPRRRWGVVLAAGSALAGAAAVLAFVLIGGPARQSNEVSTAIAQRQSITLVDGTRIDLNAHTTLQVEIGKAERHVRLSGGEAFFSVSKDKSRPFTVDTAAGSVRVTGTAFNVRTAETSTLEVTVTEGSVQVRAGSGDSPIQLGAGQRLTTRASGVQVETLSESALGELLDWRNGRVVFRDVPLGDALARISEYHGKRLTADPAAAAQRIGGRYSLDDLNEFCSALERTELFSVTRAADGSAHVSLRAER